MATLLKPSQVAARLNVSRRAAYYLISSGEIPSIQLGPQMIRVDEDDLNQYIEDKRRQNATIS
ncbi:helix-turn-helix domain-containing protein [bacterium]|nr:helix-turn-helix domain-containing protein [bacterium]